MTIEMINATTIISFPEKDNYFFPVVLRPSLAVSICGGCVAARLTHWLALVGFLPIPAIILRYFNMTEEMK